MCGPWAASSPKWSPNSHSSAATRRSGSSIRYSAFWPLLRKRSGLAWRSCHTTLLPFPSILAAYLLTTSVWTTGAWTYFLGPSSMTQKQGSRRKGLLSTPTSLTWTEPPYLPGFSVWIEPGEGRARKGVSRLRSPALFSGPVVGILAKSSWYVEMVVKLFLYLRFFQWIHNAVKVPLVIVPSRWYIFFFACRSIFPSYLIYCSVMECCVKIFYCQVSEMGLWRYFRDIAHSCMPEERASSVSILYSVELWRKCFKNFTVE